MHGTGGWWKCAEDEGWMDRKRGCKSRRWLVDCHSKLRHSDLEIWAIGKQRRPVHVLDLLYRVNDVRWSGLLLLIICSLAAAGESDLPLKRQRFKERKSLAQKEIIVMIKMTSKSVPCVICFFSFSFFPVLKGEAWYAVSCHSLKHTHSHTLACMQTYSPSSANGLICKRGSSLVWLHFLNATSVFFPAHCLLSFFLANICNAWQNRDSLPK